MRKAPLFLLVLAILLTLAIAQCILPPKEISAMENRRLTQPPAFSLHSVRSGALTEQLEVFSADQLPLRDEFVSLNAAMQFFLGRRLVGDGILGADNMYFTRSDKWSLRNVHRNAAALAALAEKTGKEALLLLVPSAEMIYPELLPAQVPTADGSAMMKAAEEEVILLPLLDDLLSNRQASPLFYQTDHHWTQAGARRGYWIVCEALGLDPLPEAAVCSYPGFYGSQYAHYPVPWHAGDTFSYEAVSGVRLVINGEEQQGLMDEAALAGRDKYASLLYGNHGTLELICDAAPGGTLLVIKDSYANALLPSLARHYSRIIAVDPRYYEGNIVDLTNDYEGEKVLCVYGLSTLSTARTIALLDGL